MGDQPQPAVRFDAHGDPDRSIERRRAPVGRGVVPRENWAGSRPVDPHHPARLSARQVREYRVTDDVVRN
jgi:hypothetical protein